MNMLLLTFTSVHYNTGILPQKYDGTTQLISISELTALSDRCKENFITQTLGSIKASQSHNDKDEVFPKPMQLFILARNED